jgi:hypothetical protein
MKKQSLFRSLRQMSVVAALAAVFGAGFTGAVYAQDAATDATAKAQMQSDIALIRAAINADRVEILSDYLGLTETEAVGFWPLYKSYRTDIAKVNDDQMKMIGDFLKNMDTMSDDDAKKMTESYINAKKKKLDVQKGYVGKFAKVLPGRKVARLYQLENKVDTYIAYQASDSMPLMSGKSVK